jgi:hypothetical protein
MRGSKKAEANNENFIVKADWPWTFSEYELSLKGNVKSITIDPLNRMADIDRNNNVIQTDKSKTFIPNK